MKVCFTCGVNGLYQEVDELSDDVDVLSYYPNTLSPSKQKKQIYTASSD